MTRDPDTPDREPRRGAVRVSTLALTAGLLIGLGIVAMGTAVEVSSRPEFCGSCHVMAPYYDSWRESRHSKVACVDCHIPPGVTAEFKKKYEALSMVASYFTGTYGTNPWAEIDDAACLRCHERRLLSGRELFGDILFDHAAHLAGMRRGKDLRCTSCHSQIVQGSHIAVTASTCILCHFKDQPPEAGTARCTLCHHIPDKVIRHESVVFDHADVGRFGMQCTLCHARPEGSDGAVPRERCVTCHNQPSRLEQYDQAELLHRTHVSEHKVDCLNCHLEIQHVGPPRLETATTACNTCHVKGHSPQMNLYAGIGGIGVEPMPDPMFLAGVRCEGCHIEIPGQASDIHRASDISCMSCHGPAYRGIFLTWKEGLADREAALEGQVSRTRNELPSSQPQALVDATFNLALVTRGRGIHNVRYANALLKRAHEDMNAARGERGLAPLPVPWPEAPYDSDCLTCHQGIESTSGPIFGREFSHTPHVVEARLECSACHRSHDAKERQEVVRFDSSGCGGCHHHDAAAECLSCHTSLPAGTVKSPLGDFDHMLHAGEMGQACTDCHDPAPGGALRLKRDFCAGCHG